MFTGIIRSQGVVTHPLAGQTPGRLVIRADQPDVFAGATAGDSIAVNGACLTLVSVPTAEGVLEFDVIAETLALTTIGSWTLNTRVNLEGALRVGDALGGHFVQGHVDHLAEVSAIIATDNSHDITLQLPDNAGRLCIDRGSIAVNGVSLTVMHLDGDQVAISLIPETLERTALGELAVGDRVHVELDMIARHVEQLLVRASAPVSR